MLDTALVTLLLVSAPVEEEVGRVGPQPVEVLFDRICRENGISHRHTAVRSPTTTGKIERFHQSLRKAFLADRAFASRPDSPAGDLARYAGIAPSTAASHLQKLVDAGLLSVTRTERSRLYQLSSVEVARAIESLAVLAPAIPVRSLRQSRDSEALRAARSCYDHLAGRLGVTLHDELVGQRMIRRTSQQDYDVTKKGLDLVSRFGVDVEALRSTHRMFARACLRW